jgi:hypothetical protein
MAEAIRPREGPHLKGHTGGGPNSGINSDAKPHALALELFRIVSLSS